MAPLPPLPSSPSLDYTILRQFVPSDPFSVHLRVTLSVACNPDDASDFEAYLDLNDLTYTKFLYKFAARQFGFVQAIPAPAKFFIANTAVNRPPTKSTAEVDRISAMGNRLRRFFKLVSFRPNHTGVMGFRYAITWDYFADRVFGLVTQQAIRKTIHPLTVPFLSRGFSLDATAQSAPGAGSEETSDHNSEEPPSSSVVSFNLFVRLSFPYMILLLTFVYLLRVQPIPTSSSVPASEKRPIDPEQSTPPPPPKRRKSFAKKSTFTRAEDTPSADVPEQSVPDEPISIKVVSLIDYNQFLCCFIIFIISFQQNSDLLKTLLVLVSLHLWGRKCLTLRDKPVARPVLIKSEKPKGNRIQKKEVEKRQQETWYQRHPPQK
uniref:Uncharacterized protein n=1 Tax=Ananas comosus var. bracteatus TaxID=296719 RepID=A0A6V7PQC9_ANACO|nr:unnamed protein product [Ananas comosus var. bracteatus]